MTKPPEGGYSGEMEITDYMLWKLVIVAVVAFCYCFWKAFTGR